MQAFKHQVAAHSVELASARADMTQLGELVAIADCQVTDAQFPLRRGKMSVTSIAIALVLRSSAVVV